MSEYKIELVKKTDIAEINQLLNENYLPEIDTDYPNSYYLKAIDPKGKIIGAIGIEAYEKYGLLRSLVVDSSFRDQKIATHLVSQITEKAEELQLEAIYLLTTTADLYFEKKNFKRIERTQVPDAVKRSSEFSSICPLSSTVMTNKII